MSSWITDYLGKPWQVGANGPDAFDCWGLLEDIYKTRKGIILSRYADLDKLNKKEVCLTMQRDLETTWQRLESPVDLCLVTLSNLLDRVFHVGCYIEKDKGYVIHTQKKSGCMIEPMDKIVLNWKHISFYGLR